MVCMNISLQLEISYSSGSTLTLALIVLMPQITYTETKISHTGQNYDNLAYHNYTTDYPIKKIVLTLSLIMNMQTNHL